jgi:hypothetical protein
LRNNIIKELTTMKPFNGTYDVFSPRWGHTDAYHVSSVFKSGCNLLAEVIEVEADVPKAERVLTPPVPGRLEVVAKAEETHGKKVPWNPSDKDYIPARDAVEFANKVRPGFEYNDLNKVLKEDGPMRYMLNPDKKEKGPGSVRCKVHKGDLETWCDGLRRTPATKTRPGRGKPAKPAQSDDEQYEKGFAEGNADGYRQGYADVKQGLNRRTKPSFPDDPADTYVHGQYEGWKKGYAKGWDDSNRGIPQQF